MLFNIDLDRGVQSRSDPQTGMEVYMYWDEPGVYRSAHGTEIALAIAERCGFPIEEHLKQRRIKEALKSAHDKVMADLASSNPGANTVVEEKEGFKLVDIGYDRYQVYSPDGDVLHPQPLTLHVAKTLLDQLVPATSQPVVETNDEAEK